MMTWFTSAKPASNDGEQAWILTFRTDQHTLYAVRESRGHDVLAEILAEDFTGTVVCGGWTAYPAFSSNPQRCWTPFSEKPKMQLQSKTKTSQSTVNSSSYTSVSRLGWRPTCHGASERKSIK